MYHFIQRNMTLCPSTYSNSLDSWFKAGYAGLALTKLHAALETSAL